ncbi:MAG: hypothetical protein AB8B85_09055 [Paracoccaceae bacterium]
MNDRAQGHILDETDETPPVHDVTPGWVGRNRHSIERGRNLTRALMLVAPPPARIAFGAVSVAADAILLADEVNRRLEDKDRGTVRASALVLEGVALVAVSRFAPARLAANLAGIEAARGALARIKDRIPR